MANTTFASAKYKLYGIVMLAIIACFVSVCAAAYGQAFTRTEPIYLQADRAGLQMYPGNRVQMRGVDVGKVGKVALGPDGRNVMLTLNMMPSMIGKIPANVNVELAQLTAFGPKSVELSPATSPPGPMLTAGSTLRAGDHVAVEANFLFDDLNRLLQTASPAKVDAVLGGLAQALNGRGDQIGDTAAQLAGYLGKFNGNLPTLRQDFAKSADVADLYADVAPQLTAILDNATYTGQTVISQRRDLHDFLSEVGRVSDVGSAFLADVGDQMVQTVADALPTTDLLRKYSPEFECTIKGVYEADKRQKTVQANTVPGIQATVTLEPGNKQYANPRDRTVVGSDDPPNCYGLPVLDGVHIPKEINNNFDKGGYPNPSPGDNRLRPGDPPLVVQLFGPQAGRPLANFEKRQSSRGEK
jgi:phospholipid/cholesterol/gamma-HCH transport system substrate-binding protein